MQQQKIQKEKVKNLDSKKKENKYMNFLAGAYKSCAKSSILHSHYCMTATFRNSLNQPDKSKVNLKVWLSLKWFLLNQNIVLFSL